jgi:trans-AT polyketide synthase/acyltransferase/oxidoreductase domain-containing protein
MTGLHAYRPTMKTGEAKQEEDGILAGITAASLGSPVFRTTHGVRYAYVTGSMYKGIASTDLVIRVGRAGLLGYFGTGGLKLERIEEAIGRIKRELGPGRAFGMNLLCNLVKPEMEDATVDVFLRHGVTRVEASAYLQVTPSLVHFRLKGLREVNGRVTPLGRILAKISRPEIAAQFLAPPPEKIVHRLLEAGKITRQEAALAPAIPVADELCVEADSGGHTDNGVAFTMLPVMFRMRDDAARKHGYQTQVLVGAAGGIGTPHAAAAAFVLGADFILTGSVNQCTVEAGTSDLVKDMLAGMNIQDTAMAPAGDMFEIGAKVQVLSKGVFFPARAAKLHELYRQYDSLEAIDAKTRQQLETRYFKRSIEAVFQECKEYYSKTAPEVLEQAEKSPKAKMVLVFRWYFVHTSRMAMRGEASERVDFQVHTGPALGAFNQWVKGSAYEDWRNRHADEIAEMLMTGAARILRERVAGMLGGQTAKAGGGGLEAWRDPLPSLAGS